MKQNNLPIHTSEEETEEDIITDMCFSKSRPLPFTPKSFGEIDEWCKHYHETNKFPVSVKDRFAIGIYQLHQGMSWKDNGVNKYEAFAAAALHFNMVRQAFIKNKTEIEIEFDSVGVSEPWQKLLYYISQAQQHIVYHSRNYTAKRRSRFDPKILSDALEIITFICIFIIPYNLRTKAFEAASTIMTKELK